VTELSPRARALFEAGRKSLQPNETDRERVFAALAARLGDLGPDGAGSPKAPAAASGVGWPVIAAVVAGLAVTGAGSYALFRTSPPRPAAPTPSSAPPATTRAAPDVVPPPLPTEVPQAIVPQAPSPSAARAGVSAQPSDRLAEEVAILSEAERDLHAGQYQNALRLLDEHRRKFPKGTLAQERMAARVQALCGLGRVDEAQAALARLTRLSPNSPHQDDARQACAPKK